jgi:hypothetical protein
MNSAFLLRRLGAVVIFTITAFGFTGCVTRGYKLADKSVPPAVPLDLTTAPAGSSQPADAAPATPAVTLHAVIVYQGPGSWKREAYWDEYMVSIANRGDTPLVVSAAALTSTLSEPVAPGDDPWKLERLSKTWWQSNAAQQTKTFLLLGTGTAAGAGVAVAGALTGVFGPVTATGALAMGVGSVVVVTLPIVAVGTVAMNLHRKHQVQEEFTRRRLALPLTIAPGQVAQGSLFFRITPAPQRLTLNYRTEGESRDAIIDLSSLAGLHLKPATVASATRPASP